ncbi:MAG: glycosyltransferase family 47 protein [Deltaproteobacteria bacterium]|jgi:hypothetical protein|nr:glycosyltransferase family 47 protein [Deltaproteobacteria bacterium]
MRKLRCYVYQEGRDFILPDLYLETSRSLSVPAEGVLWREDGAAVPHTDFFTLCPAEEAELFFFPYDLGPILNILGADGTTALLKALPYLAGRERRHVFTDRGSFVSSVRLPVCLLKVSLTSAVCSPHPSIPFLYRDKETDGPDYMVLWLPVSAHVQADRPSFDWGRIRYDCSFVGAYSHVWRNAACRSMELCPGLRFYNGGFDDIILEGNIFSTRERTPEEKEIRRARFRKISKESLTILCPPGIGPQSFRMYEAMYYGRIPVLISGLILYPLQHLICFRDFCLIIDEGDVLRSGSILRDFLARNGADALREKCILARKTYLKYFTPENRPRRVAGMLTEYLEKVV